MFRIFPTYASAFFAISTITYFPVIRVKTRQVVLSNGTILGLDSTTPSRSIANLVLLVWVLNLKPYGLLKRLPVPQRPWNSISMDFIETLPTSSGHDTILVI